jgi:hypothetical protein
VFEAARATGAFYAVWPLFVTKTLPCISKVQQEWLLGRLNHIGDNFGLQEEVVTKSFKPLQHGISAC